MDIWIRECIYSVLTSMLRHAFIAIRRTKVKFSAGGEFFHCVGQHVIVKGFTSVMPWMSLNEKNLPQFSLGERINILKVDLYEVHFPTAGSFFFNSHGSNTTNK